MGPSMSPKSGIGRSKSVSPKTTDSARRSQNTTDKAGRLILPFETGIAVPAATPRRRRPSRSEIQADIASHHSQPVKIPAKSPQFWSSLAGRFWSSRSNSSHCSSTAVGCSSGSCVLIKKRSSFEINLF